MAPAHPSPYDPVKTVEGMFNGTLARLGQFFKDPKNYGANTKVVLSETAKRYQDALDDCEIQILEAKWYLENMLEGNRALRESAAKKADVPVAKRKLDEMENKQPINVIAEGIKGHPAKRPRLGSNPLEAKEEASTQPAAAVRDDKEPTHSAPALETNTLKDEAANPATPKPSMLAHPKPAPENVKSIEPPAPAPPPESRPSTSAGPQQSTQGTPGNEDINFESMFGEASNEETAEANFSFNLGLDAEPVDMHNMAFADGDQDPNQSSLNSLLPGLESYANQADIGSNIGLGFDFSAGGGATGVTQNGMGSNNFGLPEMPNSFDELLEENNMNESFGGGDEFLDGGNLMELDDLDMSFADEK